MKFIFKYILVFLLSLCFHTLYSQNATVRGFVYNKENGEPVMFATVYLKGTTNGTSTDVNGFYLLSNIKKGSNYIIVSSIGYDTIQEKIIIKGNEIITKKLYVEESVTMLGAVNISADRQAARTETRVSVTTITPKQLSKIPTVGGIADIAQYMQVVPGVIHTGDQGGQLYIRGGTPIQNKVLLDGMVIYNPFHSIGLFSVFDTDIIRNMDVYTGGFGAEHGGRISSIMKITTKDGNKKRTSGNIGINPFGAKLMLEGPLKKATKESTNTITYILSAKNSYLEKSSKLLYNYIDTNGLPFNYRDLYGKLSFNGRNGSKVSFFGFNFSDNVNYQILSDYNWKSYGVGSSVVLIPESAPVLIEGSFAYSKYNIMLEQDNLPARYSEINGFNANLGFTYFKGNNEIKYGIELLGFNTDFSFYNVSNRVIQQEEYTTEMAFYLKYKYILGKFIFEPGYRFHYYASLSNLSNEPRFSFKYNINDNLRLKFASGLYAQNLISATSDKDVVSLFYGFLSGSENLPREFKGEPLTHKLQKSRHLIFGIEYDYKEKVFFNIEPYYIDYTQLTSLNRNKIFNDDPDVDQPDIYKKDYIVERGNSYGVDCSVKYSQLKYYFWAVYSLGFIKRSDEVIDYIPHFDRRHNVNLLASVEIGKGGKWELNARWNLGSGFPFTMTQGYFGRVSFADGMNTDYTKENEVIGVLYGELNKGRLPYYHRLDLTIKKTFFLGFESKLETNFSITNAYNRRNVFYFDRVNNSRVDQLPLMPSIGLVFKF